MAINDLAENNFLYNTFKALGYDVLAIGLTDKVVEDVWIWPDGVQANYFNWEPWEPNNQGNEDYAVMHIQTGTASGQWNDYTGINLHLGISYPGIIEANYIVPVPSAVYLFASGLASLLGIRRYRRS